MNQDTRPFVTFWLSDKCVYTHYDSGLVPRKGDTVSLHLPDADGLFTVKEVLWCYANIPCAPPNPPLVVNKIEVHLTL